MKGKGAIALDFQQNYPQLWISKSHPMEQQVGNQGKSNLFLEKSRRGIEGRRVPIIIAEKESQIKRFQVGNLRGRYPEGKT
jgi:hypothetical protein